jgi:serine phosphatase RsbU (regulator of sigma subunit)
MSKTPLPHTPASSPWRREGVRFALGLAGVGVALVIVLLTGTGDAVPVNVLLIPVLVLAIFARPRTTAALALVASVCGWVLLRLDGSLTAPERVRIGALAVGSVIAVVLAAVRTRRERAFTEQQYALAIAQQRADAEAISAAMTERMPSLTEAPDIHTVATTSCRIARDLFDSDSASYWQVDGDACVLVAREPHGSLPLGTRVPVSMFATSDVVIDGVRTGWIRRDDIAHNPSAEPAVARADTSVGTSTAIRVGGVPVAYLGLGWTDERSMPSQAWMSALDRFCDQIAIAKTVVRRRLAQQEAQNLGRRLQAGLLPVRLPTEGRVHVRSEYRPGTRHLLLGGDFLDVVRDPADDSVAFLLGDVSGHGPEQAALGTMMRAAWVGVASLPSTSLKEWVSVLDYVVQERRPSDDLFVTVVMGRVDIRRRLLHYVLAGHPPPIMLRPDVTALPTGDPPLGVLPEAVVTLHTVELPEEWALLLVTDGLYEGRVSTTSTERVGYDGFLDILREREGSPVGCDEYLRLLADEMEHRNGGPLPDDAAAVLISPRMLDEA